MNQPASEALVASRAAYDNGYYGDKLRQGVEFQDVVTAALYQRGIVIVGYASRRFQIERGENLLGAEIKRDGMFRQTGNLYIETAEKAHPDNPAYVPAGIRRDDNSWLYVIGDEIAVYVFSVKYLRKMQGRYRQVTTHTSTGFLMPVCDAETYCLRRIDLGSETG